MTDIADRLNDLPPRDPSKPDTEQGLFQKFVVTRTDGSSGPGGKHEGCEYFVLDIDHDPMAKWALEAYANACETTHPQLAADLRARYRLRRSAIIDGDFSSDMVGVPILRAFDESDSLGWLQIRRDALPPTPNWCFGVGYRVEAFTNDEITGYSLQSVAIIPDADYRKVIDREQALQDTPQLYGSQERILRRRARAFGIARDVADGFASRRGEIGETSTYRQLINLLLAEPEVVTAIADWRQAAREAVDADDRAPIPAGYSAEERPRATLARHEALAVRCTLSAHHEEWWRLHRELEQSQRELHQLMADGFSARRRAAGRLQSDAASAAAIDALRDAEMPQAVPGRCRDLAKRLRNFTPESQMGGSWTVGMAADLLEQIADAWNRRPASGMNLSQERTPAVHATPVLLETTAMWAGAQTAQTDGAVHFSAEAWAKFVKCLGEEPPLEILTSPGISAPAHLVHPTCARAGCEQPNPCDPGKCALGPGDAA